MSSSIEERAYGALAGLAVGDALGMPTQGMERSRIADLYGRVDGLRDAVGEQPIAPGMPAGSITDDTEQALLTARLLIDGAGTVLPREFAGALVDWEHAMAAKGSRDLLGPSTKAAVTAISSGVDPASAGTHGATNGAAMRITPVAIAVPPQPADALLAAIWQLSHVSHNTSIALAGAAAVAGAVSAAIEGADGGDASSYGLDLSERAGRMGQWVAGASVPVKARWAIQRAAALDQDALSDFLVDVVGTSVQAQESVVAAYVIADRYRDDPYAGLCLAARIGGDTDTIAAMAGAMLGAVHGAAAFPAEVVRQVTDVSELDLATVLTGLLELRAAAHQHPTG